MPSNQFILHIETATDVCSVAISEADYLISKVNSVLPNQHSEKLTVFIQDALNDAKIDIKQLSAVALSSGPGSYTSLRVGSSVAKGICYGLDIPLISVDTLQSIAAGAAKEVDLKNCLHCPAIDARRMEIYAAIYDDNNELVKEKSPIIIDEQFKEILNTYNKKIIFSGNGAEKCKKLFFEENFIFFNTICDSSNMLDIAYQKFKSKNFENVAYFSPDYLKPPQITTSKKIFF